MPHDHGPGCARTELAEAVARALAGEDDVSLDTGASLLAAAPEPEAAAVLAGRGADLLGAAWRHGWEPADVARLVRRDLRPAHLALLSRLVARETAGYPALDARWRTQVSGLAAEAEASASAVREDRFTAATTALELLRLLLRLPPVEPLGPPPGGPAAGAAPAPTDDPVLSRIRALLAKAEATTFPEEAEALSAKAQELMARHRVDEAQLAAGRREATAAPEAVRVGVEQPYGTAKAILLDAVARANNCRAVWNEQLDFSTVVGFPEDLAVVELLHTSLLVQATTAMTRAEAAQRRAGRRRTKTFRQSFLLAYAGHIGTRLTETSARVAESAPGDLLPVLAAREVAVGKQAEHMFPRTTAARVRGATDEAGWQDGREAARGADLGRPGRKRVRGRE
ncbi:DUF2786 domain-containing protein [Streptomyces sp. NPDC007088]|uniref:DUF2786 domain-containing protein n=1 Tax=Streptomyces sp. NPDC007088 TaxID=3364773 RepID=UPI0036925C45